MVGGSILLPLPDVLPIRKGQDDVVRSLWDPHVLQSALHDPGWEIPSGKPVISLFSFIRSTTSLTSKGEWEPKHALKMSPGKPIAKICSRRSRYISSSLSGSMRSIPGSHM